MYTNIYISNRTDFEESTVYLWDDEKGLIAVPYNEFHYAFRKSPAGTYQSIYGQKLQKIKKWARNEAGLFESDVGRELRVLSDLYLDSDEVSKGHNLGVIDIETSSVGGFANIEKADKEIYSICMYSQKDDQYMVFLYDRQKRYSDRNLEVNVAVMRFDTEQELYGAFLAWFSEQHFTLLTGWNIHGFDIPYLYRRIKVVLGEHDANMLSSVGLVSWSRFRERYRIAGISCLDYIELYKKYRQEPRASYRLDYIGEAEGIGAKVHFDMTIDNLYASDLDTFIQYNLQDVRIVVGLDRKFQYIELARSICHEGHVPYEDFMYSSKFIEGAILVDLHRKNMIAPDKSAEGRETFQKMLDDDEKGFEGAYVKDPVPGLYDWVYSLDLQSLYPSIVMSLNISPETKVGKVFNWDIHKHIRKEIAEYEVEIDNVPMKLHRNDFVVKMESGQLAISPNGILYMNDKPGIIPSILDRWFAQRKEFRRIAKEAGEAGDKEKEAYYDRRQFVQKIFLNSIYGALGLPIFRFYDIDNAAAVTSAGQEVIKTSATYLNGIYSQATKEKKDYCIYIDTDSVYFPTLDYFSDVPHLKGQLETDSKLAKEETIKMARMAEQRLNQMYDTMAWRMFFLKRHRFVIRGEKIAKTAFWVVKKRYALLTVYDLEKEQDKDQLVVKGLDSVRSSFPVAFGEFLKQTIKHILDKTPKSEIDKNIVEFCKSLPNRHYLTIARNTSIKNGIAKYDDPTEKVLTTFKKGTPIHVKSALAYNRYLKLRNLHNTHALIRDGDKIKYVYLKENPLGLATLAVKGYDDPKEVVDLVTKYIDANKLFERELQSKLEGFYDALNWGPLPAIVDSNVKRRSLLKEKE